MYQSFIQHMFIELCLPITLKPSTTVVTTRGRVLMLKLLRVKQQR